MTKKHPQFILAMDQAFFEDYVHSFREDLNEVSFNQFLGWPETMSALVIKERAALEPNPLYRQLLPYLVVRRHGADKRLRYLTYQRTQGVGESRLAGKVSIGFGGHIDGGDVLWGSDGNASVPQLEQTIMQAAYREAFEELRHLDGKPPQYDIRPADLFITHDEGVQRVHAGIVMYMDVPDDNDLTCAEAELRTIGWLTANEIMAGSRSQRYELEVWTRLLLEKFIGEQGGV
jgi:predicted NUDIX family phosphoesterase